MVGIRKDLELVLTNGDTLVNNDSKVVIVTPSGDYTQLAWGTKIYWSLKVYGHQDVHLLNGGMKDWIDEIGTLSKEPSNPKKGNFTTKSLDMSIYASKEDTIAVLAKEEIIDARPMEQYLGVVKRPYAKKSGHIKGAKSIASDLLFQQGVHFKSVEDLKKIFDNLQIDTSGTRVVVYCNTGHLSSLLWFSMQELVGIKARLYDGSMAEWDGVVSSKLEN